MKLFLFVFAVLKVTLCVAKSSSAVYGTNFFAESQSTYYDGYAQAWRYLGWYVQCGSPSDRYEGSGDGEGGSQHSGSGDDQRYYGNNYCQRFLIWAAVRSSSFRLPKTVYSSSF